MTTNHAEVIRDYLEDPMMSAGPSKALAALDALTREADEAKVSEARAWEQRKHDDEADTACRNLLSEELDEARATIAAQADRIKHLEATLAHYTGGMEDAEATNAAQAERIATLVGALTDITRWKFRGLNILEVEAIALAALAPKEAL